MGHDWSDATLAARCPMHHSYETAAFWRDKIFYLYSKSKMYYLFERSWGNVHKDPKCHALCLSVLGNKYIVHTSHNKRKSQHINMSTQYVRCRSSRIWCKVLEFQVEHMHRILTIFDTIWTTLQIPTVPSCSDLGQKSHFMCYASDWSWCCSVLARRSHLKWDLSDM